MLEPSASLQFRRLALTDADAVFELWSDFETVKFTNWFHTATRAECIARLERILRYYALDARHFGPYCVHTAGGQFVGLVGADLFDAKTHTYSIWYVVQRASWGQRLGSHVLQALIAELRASGRVDRLIASVVAQNARSRRLLERQGFTARRFEPAGHTKHGAIHDLITYQRAC
jgi:RimJ/RimL family protein N-acetyltransferase